MEISRASYDRLWLAKIPPMMKKDAMRCKAFVLRPRGGFRAACRVVPHMRVAHRGRRYICTSISIEEVCSRRKANSQTESL
eukprot:scaffold670815_cov43-Prasinocladus_malaysianus.AAC.1